MLLPKNQIDFQNNGSFVKFFLKNKTQLKGVGLRWSSNPQSFKPKSTWKWSKSPKPIMTSLCNS
jgi:hypothetical protein